MIKHDEKLDDPIYVADPQKERAAKSLHYTVSIIRLLGIAVLMLGIAITFGKVANIPAPAGYVLMVIGLFQTWIIPFIMVRKFVSRQASEQNKV